ncbi:MAG: tetratricopeptide repeat protein [Lachnospiraceae bacterium]|nr:tetratricopeptide repeat protein [Lachnospiraceae bacterium]
MSEEVKNPETEETTKPETEETTKPETEETTKPEAEIVVTKKKKGPLTAVIVAVAVLVILVIAIFAVLFATGRIGGGKKTTPGMSDKFLTDTDYDITTLSCDELIQIAEKALNDGEYDKAIENYEKALEIDEMSVEAYLGLVEAYIRNGDFDKALEAAKRGYEKTGDQRLKDQIDMIEGGNIHDSRGLYYKQTFYDGEGTITGWLEYTYDKTGNQTSVTGYGADGTQKGYVNLVSDEENVTISTWYSYDGVVGKIVYKNDDQGRHLRSEEYNEDGTLRIYSTYEYEGEKSIETQYSTDGEIEQRYIRYSEGDRNILEYYGYTNGEFYLTTKVVYEGDKQTYYDADGNIESVHVTDRDENGNIIGSTDYDAYGNVVSSTRYE